MKNKTPLTPAQKQFATENAGLIWFAMKVLVNTNLDSDERLSACGLALVHAVRAFDPSKGSFSPYYMRWAKSLIGTESGNGLISVPKKRRTTIGFQRVGLKNLRIKRSGKDEPEDIHELLRSLYGRHREVMNLMYVEGKSRDEIAEMWGTSKNNVNTQYNEAVKKLREIHRHRGNRR